ncbi:MAG TPA: S41 family peptidase, partial [Flavisolibacter sp.]
YGGTGMGLVVLDNQVTVRETFPGFPAAKAGIIGGDIILEVNGTASGGDLDATIDRLRGEPGSHLNLLVKRKNTPGPISITITREEIKMKAVPYFGMIADSIAYIRINSMSYTVGDEVKEAFLQLRNPSLKGLVIDLRDNIGGALSQAVKIANIFIDKGKPIVKAKGKTYDTTYYSTTAALDSQLPLVVLTNQYTASSAEILTGALQDHDRAMIIGQNTFGKGLIQNMFPFDNGTMALITTGFYYTPSGRCIQVINHVGIGGDNKASPDSMVKSFSTFNGRIVKSRQGIIPDLVTTPQQPHPLLDCLQASGLLFKFALDYQEQHPSIAPAKIFRLSMKEVNEFLKQADLKNCSTKTETEKRLEALRESASREMKGIDIESYLSQIEKEINRSKAIVTEKDKQAIQYMLEQEIMRLYYHDQGVIELSFRMDNELKEAISFLKNPTAYKKVLAQF